MSDQRIRLLVVDDHPLFLKGLTATLDPEPDMEVVGCASNGSDALRLFRETNPDVTIMDVTLTPDMTGIDATAAIRREFPEARVIMLTANQREDLIYRALRAGAATYLLKETLSDELVCAIREVYAGGGQIPPEVARKLADRTSRSGLTPRELEVLQLIAKGSKNKEIASHLALSVETVQSHVKSIFAKLVVNDRTKAAMVALERGIIDPPG